MRLAIRIGIILSILCGTLSALFAMDTTQEPVEVILKRFTTDYAQDISLKKEVTFGIRVDDQMYSVHAIPSSQNTSAHVDLKKGNPENPTYYFKLDSKTLEKLDRGEWNGLTAQAKAFESDFAPLDMDVMVGFQPGPGFVPEILDVSFHFWTRGNPEIIPYGNNFTRFTHGADVTIFFYQPGLRSAWGSLKKGMHANQDPRSQINEFPSLVIFTQGKGVAKIGGKEITVQKGQAILIPAGVTHEFWNANEESLELVLLMFGEGA
jgi:mannose-6-phosphate isomerase-like protein (cupin superfamily)